MNIAILESEELFREGIKLILEGQKRFNVVLSNDFFSTEILTVQPIDILLIGLNLFRENKKMIKEILEEASLEMKIVVLADTKEKNYVIELVRFGVDGYLLKRIPPTVFVEAINMIYNGLCYICPLLTGELLEDYLKLKNVRQRWPFNYLEKEFKKPEFITDREFEVLSLIANGDSNSQISQSLNISEKTVKKHVNGLFKKMGVTSRTEVAVKAIRQGWIAGGPW